VSYCFTVCHLLFLQDTESLLFVVEEVRNRSVLLKKRKYQHHLYWMMSLFVVVALVGLGGSILYLQTKSVAHASPPPHNFTLQLAHPHYWYGGAAAVGMNLACQSPTPAAHCYTPQQIQNAYHVTPLHTAGITGAGHTMVIVDAFQSPTIRHDLQMFDRVFGLKDPTLNILAPDGLAPFNQKDPVQVSWAAEITLDVEWAHAVAPGAAIDLVLSNPAKDPGANTLSGFLLNLSRATAFAVKNNLGDVISQSFGGNEACMSMQALQAQHKVFQAAVAKHITLLAASGDRGAAEINCTFTTFTKNVSTPASDPLVTAVGGTTLNANATTGAYIGETAWMGSGGGFSTVFPRPAFQQGVQGFGNQRGVPDIAYNADPRSGVLVVWSSSGQGNDLAVVFGGTSAGSPQWAGITVLLNQMMGKRIGFLNGALYRLGKSPLNAAASLHDITMGMNNFVGKDANGVAVAVGGFDAGKGWDPVTGWGTPDVARLVMLLPGFV
jgi:subtilase family serine protease